MMDKLPKPPSPNSEESSTEIHISGVSDSGSSDGTASKDVQVTESGIVLNKKKSSKTVAVGEEAWSTAAEKLVMAWADDCDERSKEHEGKKWKDTVLHSVFGLPSILLPVVFAAATPLIDTSPHAVYIQVAGYISIGIFTSVNAFYNFKTRATKHAEFANRFSELNTDVKYQLFKHRDFRISSDEFIVKVQTKYNSLIEQAP